jgi:type I restriction enzyme R subunit
MLTTGVDIPALEFIVFLRPVKSRILWEQMLGRGTRLCKDLDPPKSHFVVFDCFDGTLLKYFKNASAFTTDPPEKPSKTIAEVINDIWNNRDRAYNVRCLVKRMQRIDKEMPGEARALFAAFIPDGDLAKFASQLAQKLADDFTATMGLLRKPTFQDLLVNYPRAKRVFTVAVAAGDTVSSNWLIRGEDGKEYKPEDYLAAFARFVKENPAQIEAIRILLDRPQEWGTDALSELRTKLAATKERFTVDNLQKIHAAAYGKSLVDIISMVKHAAKEEEPLLTAGERVDRAMGRITQGQTFSEEQRCWLDRIRAHLIENLSIDRDDFDTIPIFWREGGWGKANKVFEGKLDTFLTTLNAAMAA